MNRKLVDTPVPVRLKLAAAWAALMACFIYGDYFELYQPGKLTGMIAGHTGAGPVSEAVLLTFAGLLSAPAVMIFLSLVLPTTVTRWLSILLALFQVAIIAWAIQDSWQFYVYLGLVEIALCLTIVWFAARWPRSDPG